MFNFTDIRKTEINGVEVITIDNNVVAVPHRGRRHFDVIDLAANELLAVKVSQHGAERILCCMADAAVEARAEEARIIAEIDADVATRANAKAAHAEANPTLF